MSHNLIDKDNIYCIQIICIQTMADISLIENNIGLLIWKNSNLWQSCLRKILKINNISLNEFLILKSIYILSLKKNNIYQIEIAEFVGLNTSVASVIFKLLESKRYITRVMVEDNRKKIIKMMNNGNNLYEKINPLIEEEEYKIFNKLNNESFNFTNSLKLILGKKIRIKVTQQ